MSKARMKRDTHLVLKQIDILDALSSDERLAFMNAVGKVSKYRVDTHRAASPDYIVVNRDEPYAVLVQELVLACEDLKGRGGFEKAADRVNYRRERR